jgi:hypothetical protein
MVRAARTSRPFAPRHEHLRDRAPLIAHEASVDDVISASAGPKCTAGKLSWTLRESARVVPFRGDVHEI